VRLLVLIVLMVGAAAGCSSAAPCFSRTDAETLRSIYVVKRGWHTGIVVAKDEWPSQSWPLLADFPQARYLEFGWGEATFYQAEETTFGMLVDAAIGPSPSVVQVTGLRQLSLEPAQDFEIVRLHVSAAGFAALAQSIAGSFADGPLAPTGKVYTSDSLTIRYYRARGSFYFPRMCNRWVAEKLEAGGCPVQSWSVVTAGRVMRDARGFAANE
jgi:uncharacterized protein (TIGR02117 family)